MINMIEDPYFVMITTPEGDRSYGTLYNQEDGVFLECKMLSKDLIPVLELDDLIKLRFLEDPRLRKSAIRLH